MHPKIFISYSRADHEKCLEFVRRLRRLYGHDNVWFDDDVHGGAEWWNLILSKVHWCDIFVYLLSRESIESEYCAKEFDIAVRNKKRILPILIRSRVEVPPEVSHYQIIDAQSGFTADNTIEITAAINTLVALGTIYELPQQNDEDRIPPHVPPAESDSAKQIPTNTDADSTSENPNLEFSKKNNNGIQPKDLDFKQIAKLALDSTLQSARAARRVTSLRFSLDGKYLVAGLGNDMIAIWETYSWRLLGALSPHKTGTDQSNWPTYGVSMVYPQFNGVTVAQAAIVTGAA